MAKQVKSSIFSSIIGFQKSKIILRRITSWNIMFSDVYCDHVYIAVQGTNNQEWIRFVSSMSVWQFMLKEYNKGISNLLLISLHQLSPAGGRLILASDGVWDSVTTSKAARCCRGVQQPEVAAKYVVKVSRHNQGHKLLFQIQFIQLEQLVDKLRLCGVWATSNLSVYPDFCFTFKFQGL